MQQNSVIIIDNRNNKQYEYPILKGTRGQEVVDISSNSNYNNPISPHPNKSIKKSLSILKIILITKNPNTKK